MNDSHICYQNICFDITLYLSHTLALIIMVKTQNSNIINGVDYFGWDHPLNDLFDTNEMNKVYPLLRKYKNQGNLSLLSHS